MKNVVYTYLLVAGMVLFSFTGTAKAVIDDGSTNFRGSRVDMGTLENGQFGTIHAHPASGGFALNLLSALLPSQSAVTFSYNFSGDLKNGFVAAGGRYSYELGGDSYKGYTAVLSNTPLSSSGSFVNGRPVTEALAFASADFDPNANTASVTITNLSDGFLDIASKLVAYVKYNKNYTVSYSVTETPIPAALPMFAMGLAAVVGLRRRKQNKIPA